MYILLTMFSSTSSAVVNACFQMVDELFGSAFPSFLAPPSPTLVRLYHADGCTAHATSEPAFSNLQCFEKPCLWK